MHSVEIRREIVERVVARRGKMKESHGK